MLSAPVSFETPAITNIAALAACKNQSPAFFALLGATEKPPTALVAIFSSLTVANLLGIKYIDVKIHGRIQALGNY
jgi:hypothetical protein